MLQAIQSADETVMLFIQNSLRFEPLSSIAKVITYIGEAGAIWIVIGLLLIFVLKDKRTGVLVLAGLAIGYLINDILIKNIVMRPRPFIDIPALETLIKHPSSFSFPSGHSSSGFCSAYIIATRKGGKWRWCYVLAAVIALSRPYVGVHYLSDIIVGAVLGTLIGVLVSVLEKKLSVFIKSRRKNG